MMYKIKLKLFWLFYLTTFNKLIYLKYFDEVWIKEDII